jgi:hypothetical protein
MTDFTDPNRFLRRRLDERLGNTLPDPTDFNRLLQRHMNDALGAAETRRSATPAASKRPECGQQLPSPAPAPERAK